ncbi:MAG: hypothetical protein Q9192_008697 [Flavoplaca navasiana]
MSAPVSLIDLALGLRDHILAGTFDRELVNSYLRPYAEIVQHIDPSLLADDTTLQAPRSSYLPHNLELEEPDSQPPLQKKSRLSPSEAASVYEASKGPGMIPSRSLTNISPESYVFDYTPPVIAPKRLSATRSRNRKAHPMAAKCATRGSLARIPATTEVPLLPIRVFHTSYEGSNQLPSCHPCLIPSSTDGHGILENAILAEDKALREKCPLPTAAQPMPVQDDLGNSRSMFDHILFYDQIEYKK